MASWPPGPKELTNVIGSRRERNFSMKAEGSPKATHVLIRVGPSLFVPCWLGLSDGEMKASAGTLKFRFLNWLYSDGEPMFVTQLPDDEE